jgi:SET domain
MRIVPRLPVLVLLVVSDLYSSWPWRWLATKTMQLSIRLWHYHHHSDNGAFIFSSTPYTGMFCEGTITEAAAMIHRTTSSSDNTCTASTGSSTTECTIDTDPSPPPVDSSVTTESQVKRHNATEEEEVKEKVHELECHLYMGRSTIPNAGLGIFTGQPYYYNDTHPQKNAYIGLGDICIPLIDMYTHINFYHHHHRSIHPKDGGVATNTSSAQQPLFQNPYDYGNRNWVHNPLRDYFWNGYSAMGMIHGESTSTDIEAYCPGLDCAINCHLGLVNVESSVPIYNDYHSIRRTTTNTSEPDTSLPPHRYVHPGTGAYSPYHIRPPTSTFSSSVSQWKSANAKTKKKANVLRNIPLGGELFKHYGESWFTTRQEIFGNIPLSHDYVLGEDIVEKYILLRNKLKMENDAYGIVEDLYDNILIRTIQRIYDTRTLNALPKLYSEILLVEEDDDMNQDDGFITRVLQTKHQRSIRELQETGVCLDHIRPDTSTIPHAGDGAFATRHLPNNTLITISPLHHIPNFYNFMNMYKIQQNNKHRPANSPHGGNIQDDDDDHMDDDEPYYRILDDIQNHQLLMNYCYGHANSTVLLCPYGSGINYLNHHSTLHNVRLQWIPSTSTQLLQTFQHNVTAVEHGTVEDLFRTERSQLAMQYVTTRDIQEGEELFIDYGKEWESAWNLHVQQFFDSNDSNNDDLSSYISAFYFNSMSSDLPLPTFQEQLQHRPGMDDDVNDVRHIPHNLQVRCHRALLFQAIGSMEYHYVWKDDNHGIPCRIIDRFEPDFHPTDTSLNSWNDTARTKNFLYTIQLEWEDGNNGGENRGESSSSITWILRTDVPRSAIKLYDVPFTSDIHQRRTFRHPIYLSNEIFPKQWRNIE